MYGQVSSAPKIYTDKPGQPDAKKIQVICTVAVIRGIRDYGVKDHRIKMDNPIVLSQNAKIMKQMAKWEMGDMVLIRGTLASHDYTKHCLCKNEACEDEEGKHSVISFNETLSYVNPVFTEVLSKGLDPSEGTKNMRERSEISNRVTIIGKASNEPEIYTTDQGQRITNYVLDVPRKYRIKEDDDSNRHDFLIMKSYGKIADMENMRKIVSGLQDLNLSNAMLAGILGNLRQESSFKPSALSASKTYYGLVQWGKERRTALETIPDYDTVEGQVKLLKAELQGTAPATGNYGATLDKYLSRYDSSNMQTVTDVEMACEAFCVVVEGCTGGKAENKNKAKDGKYYQDLGQRKDYAKEIYNYLEIGNISVEASEQAKEFLSIASSKLGCPYVWGAKGPNSFDCSGYVWWCLNQAGVNVPYRTTANWISDKPFPQVTSYDDLRAGDVMLISGHIVIIVGDGTIMDASSSNGKVVHRNLSDWWRNHFVGGYRIFN